MMWRNFARNAARKIGLEVNATGLNTRSDLRLISFIRQNHIETVLDVGANRCQFASELILSGFAGRIHRGRLRFGDGRTGH